MKRNRRLACWLCASGLLPAIESPAQSPPLPQTYAFTATSIMSGPTTLTVKRNASKELVELDGGEGGLHLRVLYDFQARRIYTVDPDAKTCTTQEYSSPYAPAQWDPIGGFVEMAQQAAALKTIRQEAVNGIPARLAEAVLEDGQGKYRFWLEQKFGFPVKQSVILGSQPERVVFEIRQLGYAPSAPSVFTAPATCARIGGASSATGGHAEMNVEASAQGQAEMGGAAGKKAPQAGDPARLLGKWNFTGKDGAGTQWSGSLTVQKLEENNFDRSKYSNVCEFDMSSANAGKGMSGPCLYDPRTKTLTLEGGSGERKYSFTAALSADGKSLTGGKWADTSSGNGSWSATLAPGASKKR